MAQLRADRKNYKKAFTTHAHSFDNWNIGSINSRRLILCYCVECGLKCLIMKNDKIYKVSQANPDTEKVLKTHDFRVLLKKVGQAGRYTFRQFPTEYNETVRPEEYHQICRYAIAPAPQKEEYLEEFEKTLSEIKEWLKEEI